MDRDRRIYQDQVRILFMDHQVIGMILPINDRMNAGGGIGRQGGRANENDTVIKICEALYGIAGFPATDPNEDTGRSRFDQFL